MSKWASFSDFIRNATVDEKKVVYEDVMRRAKERQIAGVSGVKGSGAEGKDSAPAPDVPVSSNRS